MSELSIYLNVRTETSLQTGEGIAKYVIYIAQAN